MAETVVLTGFMGVGKTATGRALSELLGWAFVDLDEAIERAAGKTVGVIFAEDGEEAFRELETTLLRDLLRSERFVLASGGGLLLRNENRVLLQAALVVNLDAPVEECLARVRRSTTVRPLLVVAEPEAEARKLYEARREHYEAVTHRVDTCGKSPAEVAREIASRFLGRAA